MDRKTGYFAAIAGATLLLDQATKALMKTFAPYLNFGPLSIHYNTNTGAAFGMLEGNNALFIILSLVILAAIIYELFYRSKKTGKYVMIFSAFLFGGALGNLADRILYGFVVDFIDFRFWPAFNVADIAITAGVVGLVIIMWKE